VAFTQEWYTYARDLIIVRKEAPRWYLPAIRGWWAVFQGVLGLFVTSAAEVLVLFELVKEILGK